MSRARTHLDRLPRSPFVFIVGCPRSGTTLLQRMLDHHPMLAIANDTHLIPAGLKGEHIEADPPLTAEMVARVRNYRRLHRLGSAPETIDACAAAHSTYGEFIRGLFADFAQRKGKPVAGEKTPDYVRHIPLLAKLFPTAKFIHIIRDGRDVALSVRDWATPTKGPGRLDFFQQDPIAVSALWWSWQVAHGRRDGAALASSRYMEVRYEDLVADPTTALGHLTDYLELPEAPEMARFYEGKTRRDPGLSAKRAWLPPTQGLRDWREDLSSDESTLVHLLTGDLLLELGYGEVPAPHAARNPISGRAAHIRRQWDEHRRASA